MEGCHSCGRPYDDSFADWTICRDCMAQQLEQANGGERVYFDALGIAWTQAEIDDAGGWHEVMKMSSEAKAF